MTLRGGVTASIRRFHLTTDPSRPGFDPPSRNYSIFFIWVEDLYIDGESESESESEMGGF